MQAVSPVMIRFDWVTDSGWQPVFLFVQRMGDACPDCLGNGTVRVRARPGWERVACGRCSGSGTLKPRREN